MANRVQEKRAIPSPFGMKIKMELYKKGMTQAQLAKEIGVHKTYMSDIIYGRRGAGKYEEPIKKKLRI